MTVHSTPSTLLHRCAACKWTRSLTDDVPTQQGLTIHPLYGLVNYKRLAELDIAFHNCNQHRAAVERMQRFIDVAGLARAPLHSTARLGVAA